MYATSCLLSIAFFAILHCDQLQQQRELEAKREEEASAALIQALQEEEAKEIERLRKEREDSEMLGLAVAQQIQEVSSGMGDLRFIPEFSVVFFFIFRVHFL